MKPIIFFLLTSIAATTGYCKIHLVGVDNCSFNPSSLKIEIGDTIRWYYDANTHRRTSSYVIPPGANSWDVELTQSNLTFDYVVNVAGDYYYKSNIMPTCIAHFKVEQKVTTSSVNNCAFYPNPVTTKFLLIHPKDVSQVLFCDLNGKELASFELDPKETNDELEISTLPSGTYIIRVMDLNNKAIFVDKLVKAE